MEGLRYTDKPDSLFLIAPTVIVALDLPYGLVNFLASGTLT